MASTAGRALRNHAGSITAATPRFEQFGALYHHARTQLHAHRWLLPELHAVLDNLALDHPDTIPIT